MLMPNKEYTDFLKESLIAALPAARVPDIFPTVTVTASTAPTTHRLSPAADNARQKADDAFNKWLTAFTTDAEDQRPLLLYGPSDPVEKEDDANESLSTAMHSIRNLGPHSYFEDHVRLSQYDEDNDDFAVFHNVTQNLYFKEALDPNGPHLTLNKVNHMKWPKQSILCLREAPDSSIWNIQPRALAWLQANAVFVPTYPLFAGKDRLSIRKTTIDLTLSRPASSSARPHWSSSTVTSLTDQLSHLGLDQYS